MKLLDSLLDAIVRLEGDSLVMHVGEKPYVVTASSSMNAYRGPLAWGQVELSSRVLTFDAVSSMLGQILPADQQLALTEFGAIEHEIPSPVGVADRFTVVAARGGEDVWVEVRRRPIEIPEAPEAMPQADVPADQAGVPAAVSPAPVAAEASVPAEAETTAAQPAGPLVESSVEPQVEQVEREIALVADPQAHADEHPAADVQLQASESIVVAIPGQAAQEFELNAVPDNAIQIIDDEPQGVPTEEEVDAMLAATAAALLTSGLAGEVASGEAPTAASVAEQGKEEVAVEMAGGEVALPVAEPAFELSPPPPVARVEDEAAADVDAIAEAPVGTPLFSDAAVLAAASVPDLFVTPDEAAIPEMSAAETRVADVPVAVVPIGEAPAPEVPAVDLPAAEEVFVAGDEPAAAAVAEPPAVPSADVLPLVDQAPAVQMAPTVDHAPIGEVPIADHVPGAEAVPSAEEAEEAAEDVQVAQYAQPAAEFAPLVPMSSSNEVAPVDEAPSGLAELSFAERSFTEPPVDIASADVLSSEAVVPVVPTLAAETQVEAAPAQLEASVTAEPFVAPEVVDARAEVHAIEETSARDLDDRRQAIYETPADAVVVDTLNAGAEPAVSQPTPQAWTPSDAEMTMEVTPELRRHEEPVAEVAHEVASVETPSPEAPEPVYAQAEDETRQAVVVPLARTPIKPESVSVPFTPSEDAALMHTLRIAAARGASTVYVVAQSKPMIRIDGEIGPLESEPTLTAADVDRLVMELAPPRRRDALLNGPVEWLCDVPEIGRVRCLTFKDHRGPGVLFRMFPPRAISADQLGLTPEVQALCQQSDGLVLVTGARASGKSTLLNAFVDLINRTRSDHLITIETQIGFVHESRRSFVSQRETRGDAELAATFARAALREDPDVMMIEDLKSAEIVAAALEAAESGRLVLASVPASSTIGALERLIEVFPADRRAKARTSLATALRGVVAQVLLRRIKGGRVAAREILLNTPAVSQLVLEGKMFQLPVALDSGRRHGMVPLTDSLAAQVRDGTVHVAEAYRKALDRAALVALLKREGIDTSFAERLA